MSLFAPGGWPAAAASVPDVVTLLAALRYVLMALILAAGGAAALRRRGLAVVLSLLFFALATGFWVLSLPRPYGWLVEAEATRRTAEVALAAASPGAPLLAEDEHGGSPWGMAARVVPEGLLQRLPAALPLLMVPAVAGLLLLCRRPGQGEERWLAALVWLVFSTGDLEALRGFGVLPGVWGRPGAALAFVGLAASLLALDRAGKLDRTWVVAAAVWAGLALAFTAPRGGYGPSGRLADAALALIVDQAPLLLFGLAGLHRARAALPAALVAGGSAAVVFTTLAGDGEPWLGQAGYRLGLVLAAAPLLLELLRRGGWRRSVGACTLALATGSFTAWWVPAKLDPVYEASLDPLPARALEAMAWVRANTPPDAVFVVSPEMAPMFMGAAGRRVVRAPSLYEAGDDQRRRRVERLLLTGRDPGELSGRYGITHVLLAPGAFRAYGLSGYEDLAAHARFRLVHDAGRDLKVYALAALE